MPNAQFMFLTVHAATGILIGQQISNPIFSFLLAFLLHYFLDMIPHGDTDVPKKYKNPIHIGAAGLIDVIVLFLYLMFIIIKDVNIFKLSILCGIAGAMLPDILQGFYYIFRKKIFRFFQNIHHAIHDSISKKHELNFFHGIALQITILIISTLIIL